MDAGLSMAQLAAGHFTRAHMHLLEQGRVRPSLDVLHTIAQRTNRPIEFFLDPESAGAPGDGMVAEGPAQVDQRRALRSSAGRGTRGAVRRVPAFSDRAATDIVANLKQVIDQNAALADENARLKAILAQIAGLLSGTGSAKAGAVRRAGPAAAPRARRARPAAARRQGSRRPLTDPAALERRRQSLAKARAARAARLAERRDAAERA